MGCASNWVTEPAQGIAFQNEPTTSASALEVLRDTMSDAELSSISTN